MRRALLRLELPLGVVGAACVGLAFLFADRGMPALPPALLVRLGVPSPLSGMTRSFVAMASGDVGAAFAWHPLGPPTFALAATLPLVALVSVLRGRRLPFVTRISSSRGLWAVAGVALAAAWIWQIWRLPV